MRKLKIFISFLIFFLVGIGIVIAYMLSNTTYNEYEALATVIERRSASELIVKLNDPEEKIESDLVVYSNIFRINDQLKIKYHKKRNNYIVTYVEALVESNEEQRNLASKMTSDPTIIKYTKLVSLKINSDINSTQDILSIPIKISNQEFNFMTEKDYFKNYYGDTKIFFESYPKNTEVILSLLKEFKVISVENITDETVNSVKYTFTKKTVNFKTIKSGIYSIKLDFKNGDTFNYIFFV